MLEKIINDFRDDFFPRKCYYKKDAIELQAEVIHKGGDATVEKVEKRKKVGGETC